MGDYVMENHVVEFEQDRRIAWEPVAQTSQDPRWVARGTGPREPRWWGWELESLGDAKTRVTAFFDGSQLSDGLRNFIEDGEFWRPAMVTSLDNLERLATRTDDADGTTPASKTAPKFVELFEAG
jgi:hypothetical protein